MQGEQLLKVREVAERLRLDPETVRRWLRSGKLRGSKISSTRGGYRIPESEIARLLRGDGSP